MPAVSRTVANRKAVARSRTSNGRDVLPNTGGRGAVVKRFRDSRATKATPSTHWKGSHSNGPMGVPGHEKMGGRAKGTPNKMTVRVRDVIEAAATEIGGLDRLVAWINEDPVNE